LKQQALARAPHSALVLIEVALSYVVQRKFDEAIAWIQKAIGLDPKNQRATFLLSATCWLIGDVPAAIAEKRRWADVFGVSGEPRAKLERWLALLENAYVSSGIQAANRLLLDGFGEAQDSHALMQRAACFASLGEIDAAFDHLDRALSMRDPHLVYLAVHPLWDRMRGDTRMADRLARVGLPVLSAGTPSSVRGTREAPSLP
jgi:tetratricopeptide (TPR) repeat protein